MPEKYDVVVVGGGLSGLYAASLMLKEGLNVVVLEGRDRVGGRQYTPRDEKVGFVDLGGAYFGTQQTKALQVIRELGLELYSVESQGRNVLSLRGEHTTYHGGIPTFYNPFILLDINHLLRSLDALSLKVPQAEPWNAPGATSLDNMSLETYIKKHCWTKTARDLAQLAIEIVLGTHISELSLLFVLQTIRMCGGINALISVKDGLQEFKIRTGSGDMSRTLRSKLGNHVKLSKRVIRVAHHQEEGVEVYTDDGETYKGKHAILALPLAVLPRVEVSPPLPTHIIQLASYSADVNYIKAVLYYKTRFWREKGYSGEMVALGGTIKYALDDTKPDGSHPAILVRTLFMKELAQYFDLKEFLKPIHYAEKHWQDDEAMTFNNGVCGHTYPPGVLTKIKKLPGSAVGSLHFAGTETALTFRGYMDGALRAGQRAAAEVIRELKGNFHHLQDENEPHEVPYCKRPLIERFAPSVTQCILGLTVLSTVATATILNRYASKFMK